LNGYKVEGHENLAGAEGQVITNAVAPGYFATMQIPIDRGRDFSTTDRDSSALVVIIDEPIAKQFWPGGDAVGRRIQMTGDTVWRTVVGVAGAIRDNVPSLPPAPHMYFPYTQMPGMFVNMEVRTTGDPAPVIASVKHAVAAIDPQIPLNVIMPLSDAIRSTVADRRLSEILLGGFAALALLLAAVGVYGVMSLLVSSRDREFGIRLAVGAEPSSLLRLVLGQGLRLAAAGVVLGLLGALAATRWLSALLYEVSPTDPGVFTVLALALVGVTLLACYAPSRRAAMSDPLTVLRAD
jgi:predicted permease